MSDQTTEFVVGDAAVDALEGPGKRRRRFLARKKRRLKPITHCENCGASLTGEYCARCGQHAIDYRRSLWRVLIDALDSFLNWDTKFLQSLGVLLLKPWRLTIDFNAGRRVRHIHPLRLYLLASIAFFLTVKLFQFDGTPTLTLSPADRAELNAELDRLAGPESPLTAEQQEKLALLRARFLAPPETTSAEERNRLDRTITKLERVGRKKNLEAADRERLEKLLAEEQSPAPSATSGSPTPSPAVTPGPVVAPFQFKTGGEEKTPFEAWLEGRIKEKIGEDGTNAQLFLKTLRDNIPIMMLCCIPLFAFVLKILYLRKRRYYVEHLVFALHVHSFAYIGVVAIALVGTGLEPTLPALSEPVEILLWFALFVQIFLSLRYVYGQGWFFTALKSFAGGVIYTFILAFAVAATAFITLLLP